MTDNFFFFFYLFIECSCRPDEILPWTVSRIADNKKELLGGKTHKRSTSKYANVLEKCNDKMPLELLVSARQNQLSFRVKLVPIWCINMKMWLCCWQDYLLVPIAGCVKSGQQFICCVCSLSLFSFFPEIHVFWETGGLDKKDWWGKKGGEKNIHCKGPKRGSFTLRLLFLGIAKVTDVWQAHLYQWLFHTHIVLNIFIWINSHDNEQAFPNKNSLFKRLFNGLFWKVSHEKPSLLFPHRFTVTESTAPFHTQPCLTCINNSAALSLHDD